MAISPEERRARKRERQRRWRTANPDYMKQYRAKNAERLQDYMKQYRAENAEQIAARARRWKELHPDRVQEHRRRARKENPRVRRSPQEEQEARRAHQSARRARLQGIEADLTLREWKDLLEEFDHCCAYCQVRNVQLVQEHMTPLSRGGRHTKSNVVPACGSCNQRKYTATLLEFAGKVAT